MGNHKNIAFITIILFAVLILSVINYRNINVLESRINTIIKYKGEQSNLDSEKNFKEDYYITQQSHDTNLTLVVFGVLVALSGFFTYKNIDIKFEEKAKEMSQEINNLKKELLQTKNTSENAITDINTLIKNFKIDFYIDSGSVSTEISNFHLQQNNLVDYYYHSLSSMSKAAEYLLTEYAATSKEDTLKQRTTMVELLNEISRTIGTQIKLSELYFSNSSNFIAKIRRLDDKNINHVLSILHSKMVIEDTTNNP